MQWFLYGFLTSTPSVIWANLPGLLVGTVTTLAFALHTDQSMRLTFLVMGMLALTVLCVHQRAPARFRLTGCRSCLPTACAPNA